MGKLKEFARSVELKAAGVGTLVSAFVINSAFAVGDSSTVMTALETGFMGIKTDALGVIAMIVPIAISIAAVIFIAKKAMGWFKGLAK